jgi:hypothetical protein
MRFARTRAELERALDAVPVRTIEHVENLRTSGADGESWPHDLKRAHTRAH